MTSRFPSIVGHGYAECRLSNWKLHGTPDQQRRQQEVIDAMSAICQSIVDGESIPPIVFVGPPGTGKDHIMAAMVRVAYVNEKSIVFKSGAELWSATRDVISKQTTESDLRRSYVNPDLFCVSDPVPPGAKLTEFQVGWLYQIIDGRYRQGRPTWMTLNVDESSQAESRLTPQIWSRVIDEAIIVDCNWKTFRKPKRVV